MNLDIESIRQECRKTGRSFVYNPTEEVDEEKQTAYFYFIGKDGSKEVVFNAFIMTLNFDFHMAVMEEAEEKMNTRYPKLNGIDYLDYTEAQQDEYDALMDEVYDSGLVKVQERVDIYEGEKSGEIEAEISLNLKEITDAVIEKFVRDFNADTLELDDEMYAFDAFEEE